MHATGAVRRPCSAPASRSSPPGGGTPAAAPRPARRPRPGADRHRLPGRRRAQPAPPDPDRAPPQLLRDAARPRPPPRSTTSAAWSTSCARPRWTSSAWSGRCDAHAEQLAHGRRPPDHRRRAPTPLPAAARRGRGRRLPHRRRGADQRRPPRPRHATAGPRCGSPHGSPRAHRIAVTRRRPGGRRQAWMAGRRADARCANGPPSSAAPAPRARSRAAAGYVRGCRCPLRRRRARSRTVTARLRVVIADDHPVVRDGLSALLASVAGHRRRRDRRTGGEAVRAAVTAAPGRRWCWTSRCPTLDGIERRRARSPGSAPDVARADAHHVRRRRLGVRRDARRRPRLRAQGRRARARSSGPSTRSPPARPSSAPPSPPCARPTRGNQSYHEAPSRFPELTPANGKS